jgi:hypothetical protein
MRVGTCDEAEEEVAAGMRTFSTGPKRDRNCASSDGDSRSSGAVSSSTWAQRQRERKSGMESVHRRGGGGEGEGRGGTDPVGRQAGTLVGRVRELRVVGELHKYAPSPVRRVCIGGYVSDSHQGGISSPSTSRKGGPESPRL